MKRIAILSAVVLIAIGGCVWWFSPSQALKRRTLNLLDTLTVSSGTGKAARSMKSYALNGLLAENLELNTPTIKEANGSFERAEIESGFSWLSQQARQMEFKSTGIDSIVIDGTRATVKLELEGLVELPTYRPVDGVFDVTFEWQRDDDGWRLFRATWTEK